MAQLDLSLLPPPKVIQDPDYDEVLDLTTGNFRARSASYIALIESDPGYMMMETMAYLVIFMIAKVNEATAAVLVTHATGSDLDHLGALFSLGRKTGETDSDFRVRIVERLEAIVAGSIIWYKQYVMAVVVTEVAGADNIVDGVETPVTSQVKDVLVQRTPNPSYDETESISEANLPDIPGSIDIYVQSAQWTHPTTGVLTQVIPSAAMLQAVKNYINAEGQNETDAVRLREAELRRFVCDTVNVLPAEVHPYVFCAIIHTSLGLDPQTVLIDIQTRARKFVEDQEKVGQRIPLSAFYDVINTDEVAEVILEYPTATVEPAKNEVPVVFQAHDLAVEGYETFTNVATFAAASGSGWTVESNTLLFRIDEDSGDREFLAHLRTANRISIRAQDSVGNPRGQPIKTFRVSGELSRQTSGANVYFQIALMGVNTVAGLTDATNYSLQILDSIEVRLGG